MAPLRKAENFFPNAGGPWSHLLTLALLCGYIAAFATVLHQAIGEFHLEGWHFAASYWGIAIRRVVLCRKLLGDCNFEAPICRVLLCVKLSGSFNLLCWLRQSIGELQFAGAFPVHHVS